MAHERQIKPVTADEFKSREFSVEELGDAVRCGATVLCTQVEVGSVPFSEYIQDVVPPRILRRWFDELKLQERIDKVVGLFLDLCLRRIRNLRFRRL